MNDIGHIHNQVLQRNDRKVRYWWNNGVVPERGSSVGQGIHYVLSNMQLLSNSTGVIVVHPTLLRCRPGIESRAVHSDKIAICFQYFAVPSICEGSTLFCIHSLFQGLSSQHISSEFGDKKDLLLLSLFMLFLPCWSWFSAACHYDFGSWTSCRHSRVEEEWQECEIYWWNHGGVGHQRGSSAIEGIHYVLCIMQAGWQTALGVLWLYATLLRCRPGFKSWPVHSDNSVKFFTNLLLLAWLKDLHCSAFPVFFKVLSSQQIISQFKNRRTCHISHCSCSYPVDIGLRLPGLYNRNWISSTHLRVEEEWQKCEILMD